jgi:hypothetical protein
MRQPLCLRELFSIDERVKTMRHAATKMRSLELLLAAMLLIGVDAALASDHELPPLVVSATKADTPPEDVLASFSIVTAEEIRAANARDVFEAIRRTTGVTVGANNSAIAGRRSIQARLAAVDPKVAGGAPPRRHRKRLAVQGRVEVAFQHHGDGELRRHDQSPMRRRRFQRAPRRSLANAPNSSWLDLLMNTPNESASPTPNCGERFARRSLASGCG